MVTLLLWAIVLMLLQDEKERLKGQLIAASQDANVNFPQLKQKHTFIAGLQVSMQSSYVCSFKQMRLTCFHKFVVDRLDSNRKTWLVTCLCQQSALLCLPPHMLAQKAHKHDW